jgi:hypothetical protein
VRYQSESILEQTKQCTLIRINPDYPLYDRNTKAENVISIQAKGLEAVEKIDKYLQ